MATNPISARQAIYYAQQAVQKGDKRLARHWAELAISLDSHLEEPWLILAAIASPTASIAYLQQALKIHPNSPVARQGMEWARKRLLAERTGKPKPPPVAQKPSPIKKSRNRTRVLLYLGIVAILCVSLLGAIFWTDISPALAFFNGASQPEEVSWGQSEILKPTHTSTPSPTPTATLTPTPTSTPLPEPTLVPTEIPPTTAPEETGYTGDKYILIDIGEQHLYAYQGDVLIFSFVASTGIGNSTRVGHFSVLDKIPSAYGSTWNIWMPSWLGIYWSHNLENGIHALPILPGGSILWEGYLGRPVSYGCIVLGTNEAQLLYDWAEVGIPVEIRW